MTGENMIIWLFKGRVLLTAACLVSGFASTPLLADKVRAKCIADWNSDGFCESHCFMELEDGWSECDSDGVLVPPAYCEDDLRTGFEAICLFDRRRRPTDYFCKVFDENAPRNYPQVRNVCGINWG